LQAFRGLRGSPHAGGNDWHQRIKRRAGLLLIKAELSAKCRDVYGVLPFGEAPASELVGSKRIAIA
jgi:hypothetical protein